MAEPVDAASVDPRLVAARTGTWGARVREFEQRLDTLGRERLAQQQTVQDAKANCAVHKAALEAAEKALADNPSGQGITARKDAVTDARTTDDARRMTDD